MQDRPNAAELLDAVASLLTDDVIPQLDGRSRFHVRVAANLLRSAGKRRTTAGPEKGRTLVVAADDCGGIARRGYSARPVIAHGSAQRLG